MRPIQNSQKKRPTNTDPVQTLRDHQPRHAFFVGIDSDGCAFDTMAVKQRQCFCQQMIACFGLQPIAEAACECMDFAALQSRTRGANRHKTTKRVIAELLPGHPMVRRCGFRVPDFPHYFRWVDDPSSILSNGGLQRAIDRATDPAARKELELALRWSRQADAMIADGIRRIPPFPLVRESLEKIATVADVAVLSSASTESLDQEWAEHGIDRYVSVIAGQEMGPKVRQLACATEGKYNGHHVLMIGDSPGDLEAAKANGTLFYPIIPGREAVSWRTLHNEIFDTFVAGRYAGAREAEHIAEFDRWFSVSPPWQT